MYVQLYTKSVYSLLKSALKIEDYVKLAKNYNMKSLAITDENNVYGLIKFYKECKKNDIKPILGITFLIDVNTPLILLAKNIEGYKNILRISTEIQLNSNKRIHFDNLKQYSSNLICIIPTINNNIEYLILNNKIDLLSKYILKLKNIFREDLYLSVSPEFNNNIVNINQIIEHLSSNLDIELVALNEVKYLNKEDYITLRYLEAINNGEKITSDIISLYSSNNYFITVESFSNLFKQYQKALNNTIKISEMCNVLINFNELHLPRFNTIENVASDEYLKQLCKKGIEKRLNTKKIPSNYLNRLKYELNVIIQMKYSDYFLIVYDFVKYAKKNEIYVGPGRGSAAGSLVSYVLGITNIDPIKYNLLFERFLNPERISMPDIDLDFQDDRRDEVIKYVQKKYGEYNVAHIVAFGTFASRSALREVAKVMDIKDTRINEIISYINSNSTIDDNINTNKELQKLISDFSEIKKMFDIALRIESIPRNITTHAAGIIICEEDLRSLTGLQTSFDNVLQTQYEAKDLEDLGLLKIDFLGLRNLTSISEIIRLIKLNNNIDIDINNIPLDDKKTYRLIARSDTTGIFQLESNGMRNVLNELNVSEFEDIVAVNALYRPGPMDNIPTYIARKNKTQSIEYLHNDLIPILESTYGVIVYQEQIMMVAQKIANYSLAKADILRRAVSKKLKDVLEDERVIFIENAIKNGYDKNTSERLYDYILKFGDYGFNRSHSVAYALISYQMAYLKANFLTPFMVVLLTNVLGSEITSSRYIRDCKLYGIKILPISINRSYNNYVIENNNSIRMSFLTIKGIGKSICESLLIERDKGKFSNFFDFVSRCSSFLKQNIFEALVYVGALDDFKLSKKTMIESYAKICDFCRFNQSGYFTDKINLEISDEYPLSELMKKEKEYLGFYLSTHPIRKYIDDTPNINYILPSNTLKYLDKNIEIIGFVENIKKTNTRNNDEMATLIISDDITSVRGVIFPKVYQYLKEVVIKEKMYIINCKVEERNQKVQLVIFNMKIL